MKIQLVDMNGELCKAWSHYFGHDEKFTIHHGSYFKPETDILVSPANSFGWMDGGVDLHINNYFKAEGIDIQKIVQTKIKNEHGGELLVGQQTLVFTGSQTIPYLLVVPTMRVPLPIYDAVDVYLAARAIFKFLKTEELRPDIRISICGLGTGVGNVSPVVCAHKMFEAYGDHYQINNYFPISFMMAASPHQFLIKTK